jgi:hypothetical protein
MPSAPDLQSMKHPGILFMDPGLEGLEAMSHQDPYDLDEYPEDDYPSLVPTTYSLANTPVTSFSLNQMNGSGKATVTASYEMIRL